MKHRGKYILSPRLSLNTSAGALGPGVFLGWLGWDSCMRMRRISWLVLELQVTVTVLSDTYRISFLVNWQVLSRADSGPSSLCKALHWHNTFRGPWTPWHIKDWSILIAHQISYSFFSVTPPQTDIIAMQRQWFDDESHEAQAYARVLIHIACRLISILRCW